ncbi:MAG: hypothetical protein FJX64_01310 [Alphaproteobacteria bacterium]|nr:hypothetical protein [Alphaproteobacteria bacterium]
MFSASVDEPASVADHLQDLLAHHSGDIRAGAKALHNLAEQVGNTEDAARFASVVAHVVGEESGNWDLARNLIASLEARYRKSVGVQGNMAVACYLTSHWLAGVEAETRAMAAAEESALSVCVWIRLSAAHAFQGQRDWPSCFAIFGQTLDLANGLSAGSRHDTAIAAVTNNLASDLLEFEHRTAAHDEALERAALLSHAMWQRAGSWIHQQRAEYLLALAYNALRHHDEARQAAERAIAIMEGHGDEPVDRAFINIELALALRALKREGEFEAARKRAQEIAAQFDDPGLKQWFQSKYARIA